MTSSASSPTPSPPSSASPRLYLAQAWHKTIGDVAADAAPSMGYELLGWQRDMLCNMGAVDGSGKWVHPRVGGSIPRQQGKSVSLIVWAAFLAAVMGYKVLWTEHNYSTTMEMLERFRAVFSNTDWPGKAAEHADRGNSGGKREGDFYRTGIWPRRGTFPMGRVSIGGKRSHGPEHYFQVLPGGQVCGLVGISAFML